MPSVPNAFANDDGGMRNRGRGEIFLAESRATHYTRTMATSDDGIRRVLDALYPLPVSVKKMFGEYALYLDGEIPGFVTDDTLCLKITSWEDPRITPAIHGEAYPGSKPYLRIPDQWLDDTEWIQELVAATAGLVDPPTPKKPKK